MKKGIIKLLFHNTLTSMILVVVFLLSTMYSFYFVISHTSQSIWWLWDIIWNIFGLLIILYAIYIVVRFVLVINENIGRNDSVVSYFKQKIKKKKVNV